MNWKIFLMTLSRNAPTILMVAIMLLVLVGCATKPPPNPNLIPTTIDHIEYVAYECGVPPGMTPVRYWGFVWVKGWDENGDVVWTLSAKDYARLGLNTSMTIKGVKELKGQRDFWRDCVRDSLARLEELNSQ